MSIHILLNCISTAYSISISLYRLDALILVIKLTTVEILDYRLRGLNF